MLTEIVYPCRYNGGGKSYNDLFYNRMRKYGVYTYWRRYCSSNGYYYARRFIERLYGEEDFFS